MKHILWILVVLLVTGNIYAIDKAKPFVLKDFNNNEHQLTDYADANAVVVMFISTQCPVSNAYNERMAALYDDYSKKGVVFLGINSNKQEDVTTIQKHAKENNFNFPVLKDTDNVIADQFNAGVTPEVYVLNSNHMVLYHGRIDDSRREGDIASQDLRNALDEILSGKKVTNAKTKAFGCSIKRVK